MSRNRAVLRAIPAIALVFLLLAVAAPATLAQAPGPGAPPPPPGPCIGPCPGMGPGMGPGPGGPPPAGPARRWWRNPQVRSALGLTDEQVKQIEETWFSSARDEVDLRAAAEKAHLDLARLLHQERLDTEALEKAIDAVVEADAAISRHRLQGRVAIAKLLTPEQRQKLEQLMRQHRGPRPGRKGMHPHRGRRGRARRN